MNVMGTPDDVHGAAAAGDTPKGAATVGAGLALAVFAAVLLALPGPREAPLPAWPDMTAIDDADERKRVFLAYLEPPVERANAAVRRERTRLLDIQRRFDATGGITLTDRWWLERQRERYALDADAEPGDALARLHRRVDTVPPSLALAQAAIESGWGTSRFAREGNNLFGQWCYRQGCGLVPDARPAGARHEVAVFTTVDQAVASYLNNLNVHPAYVPLRDIRAQARAEDREPGGLELAAGLMRYSERGEPYVRDVRTLIRTNGLEQN